jgi:hypothetical protein
MIKI